MHYMRNNINIYHLIRHARIRCSQFFTVFSALSIDFLSFIGGFEIDLTSFFRGVSTRLGWE